MWRIAVIFLLLNVALPETKAGTTSNFEFNERCKAAYKNICELKFQSATALIQTELQEHPDNLVPEYLQHYILFLKAFIGEEVDDFKNLKNNFDRVNLLFRNASDKSPYKNYLLAEINLMTAFNKVKFKEYVSAALEVRRAFKLLEQNNNDYPDFNLNKKCLGLLHAFIGAVPENYQWLVRIAGMNGSIQVGLNELESIYQSSTLINSEFNFMHREIGFIYLFSRQQLQPDMKRSIRLLEEMNITDNPLEIFFASNLYYIAGMKLKLAELLHNYIQPSNTYPIRYIYFLKGLSQMAEQDSMAFSNFNYYVKLYKGNSFVKAAYQKMAWIKLIDGDTMAYRKFMELLTTKGNDFTDEDKQAAKEAKEKILPNVFLLKSRILFDGASYDAALELLADKHKINLPTTQDKLEYVYRLARVYDKLNLKDQAIQNYKLSIKNGANLKYYFAAASAVFLGQLYEEEHNIPEAEKYFMLALQMRDHDYQNSLDQKAKAGLNRIGR
ncbi:MAG: hypothetical protein JSS90_09575 [Bacteroidetes bacterium]|nr:hypothetical protein [Bacteroidota bacterium]